MVRGKVGARMKMISEKRAIDKIFRRRDRYDIPDWQRGEVWNREEKTAAHRLILRGWKLPKFYFIEAVGRQLSRRRWAAATECDLGVFFE